MSYSRTACRCLGLTAALVAGSIGCDPSVFDLPPEPAREDGQSGEQRDASVELSDAAVRTRPGVQVDDAQPGVRAGATAGGAGAAADSGGVGGVVNAVAGNGGSGGRAAAGGSRSVQQAGADAAAGSGGVGSAGMAAAVSGTGGSLAEPPLDTLRTPGCPTLAPEPGAAFCYDFEEGHKGPAGGEAYLLWDTPDMPAPTELATPEQPVGSGNHVLFASPRLTARYPSATIGHDTLRFSRGLAEFDFWANTLLLDAEERVVFFRYVPDDRDFDHVTQLVLRAGQAFLEVEDGNRQELPLSRVPSATSKTHVSVVLDRSSTCSVRVYFDGEPVVASDAVTCAADGDIGAVEYGLVLLEAPGDAISAWYDNIAFGFE